MPTTQFLYSEAEQLAISKALDEKKEAEKRAIEQAFNEAVMVLNEAKKRDEVAMQEVHASKRAYEAASKAARNAGRRERRQALDKQQAWTSLGKSKL